MSLSSVFVCRRVLATCALPCFIANDWSSQLARGVRRSNVRSRPAAVSFWDSRASAFPVNSVFLKPSRVVPPCSHLPPFYRDLSCRVRRSFSIYSPICVCGSRCLLIPRLRVFRASGIVCARFVAHSGALRYRVAFQPVCVVVVWGSTRSLLHDLPCAV